jgi:hypothetical protein
MKTLKNVKLSLATVTLLTSSFVLGFSCSANSDESTVFTQSSQMNVLQPTPDGKRKKIKIALLLDTSNSMDGLINQAKSQLWKMVNELALAKCGNERPELQIALYEYGNDAIPVSQGYVRQVSCFTSDLDVISEKLFSLTTNGGNEFCAQAINTSLNDLDWKGDDGDLRIIFIAGNEPFTQGPVTPETACANAKEKKVVINTIHCGNFTEGINSGWKTGATCSGGEYMSIEQNRQTKYINSPYDDQISKLNNTLNNTYVSYGEQGNVKKANQAVQDKNAESYGAANKAERIASKASALYSNESWDLVDASKSKSFDIVKVKEEELPAELQGKTVQEKKDYVAEKTAEREKIKMQIVELNKKRTQYINEEQKKGSTDDNSLDASMMKALKEQAVKKNFVFEK